MTATMTQLPARRTDLRIESNAVEGKHVVKDPRSGGFFLLGDEEHFLLLQLDGQHDEEDVREAFEERFKEPLPPEDLDAFVENARDQGILASAAAPPPPRQNVLYWRKRVWNPDRAFARLAPRLRFLWTRGFVAASLALIAFAAALLWANRGDMVTSVQDSLTWGNLVLAWLVLFAVRGLHECAHGLTCKHYGGEVTEVGLLFMCLMPCFYCNVSDAWLFREKRKRILVMVAGSYCDLVVWSLAVLTWRISQPGTTIHQMSFLILGMSGVDTLFNFNPLMKLDGYYVLSDWKELPNLQQRALDRVRAVARWALWGADRPEPEKRGRFLTIYGILSWTLSATFVVATLVLLTRWLFEKAGPAGAVAAGLLGLSAVTSLFQGIFGGELRRMIMRRYSRTLCWLVGLGGVVATLCLVHVDEYAGGSFTVRPAVREEVRSQMAGFLREIDVAEGENVAAGAVIARLDVPDLDCRIEQRRAELREAEAQLRLLESGTRPEEIAEQRGRVERMALLLAQGQKSLERTKKMLGEELASFDQRLAETDPQLAAAEASHTRVKALFAKGIASAEDLEKANRDRNVAKARVGLVAAEKRACEARGTGAAEEDLAKHEKELGDERGKLALLEAGGRPEEIAAQKARVDRLNVDLRHLMRQEQRLELRARVAGVVVSPRLQEKTGTYVREGDVICVIESFDRQEAEIALEEEKLRSVRPGQPVSFKARALAFETLEGQVTNIAPRAAKDPAAAQSNVLVYCSLKESLPVLRTSMSGYARIYTGRHSLGGIAVERVMRLVRTEFWW